VAGPTSIGVAQVDRAISESFVETNALLARIELNTRATAGAASSAGAGVGAGAELSLTGESLI